LSSHSNAIRYSTDTQQFVTVKRFLSNQIVATEDTAVRKGVFYSRHKHSIQVQTEKTDRERREKLVSQLSAFRTDRDRRKNREEIQGPLRDKTPEGQNSL
jgi:hypothetical protein